MYPELLKIGPLTLHTYGLFVALGMLVGTYLIDYLYRKDGGEPGTIPDMALFVIVGAIVGARALFIFLNLDYFRADPLQILMVWRGGLVFYGGLIGGSIAFILTVRLKGLDLWRLADNVAPGLTLGHALGRLGCFFAGSCYGKPTDVPWAVIFTDPRSLAVNILGVPVHPVQLYSSVALLGLTAVLLRVRSRSVFTGQVIAVYGILYGILRFNMEFFRGDPRGFLTISGITLSTSQVVSLMVVPIAVAAYIILSRRGKIRSIAALDGSAA
jgi:phosphatidylglycerol:prolipoprotein diacylglycerol transferase